MSDMIGVAGAYTAVRVPRTMMSIGDSITRGVSYTDAGGDLGGYRSELYSILESSYGMSFVGSLSNGPSGASAHEGWNGYGIGYTGQSPSDIYTKGITALTTYKPGLLLLMIGTNDLLQPWTTAPIRASISTRLGTLLDDFHAVSPDTYMIISTIPPISSGLYALVGANDTERTTYNAAISGIAQARSSYVTHIDPASLMTEAAHISDGVHPNAAGYALIASQFAPAVRLASRRLAVGGNAVGSVGVAVTKQMIGKAQASAMTGRATAGGA